jgi:hypothetical protein
VAIAVNLWVRAAQYHSHTATPLPTVESLPTSRPVARTTSWRCDRRPLRHSSGLPSNRNRPALAMVLVHELCHFSGLHGSIDADGRGRFVIPLAVLTSD